MLAVSILSGLIATSAVGRPHPVRSEPSDVLHVPYVAQSELLCGGAAVAMVERWWGRRGVYAAEFAPLVHPVLGGILTTDLVVAAQARGWRTQVIRGTPAAAQQSLRDSVPVIALIRVAAGRYHYVVIVGWRADVVVFHDPAIGPFRVLGANEFVQRWAGADRWAMMLRRGAVAPIASSTEPAPTQFDSLPCRPWLDEAADAATGSRLGDAEHLLTAAAAACPSEPLVMRELAGVRFRQGRHAEAMRLADEYVKHAPADALGWQLLASSRYLAGDAIGALKAWNAIDRPLADLLRIDGSHDVRFGVLADAIDIPTNATLRPARFELAQRRLADIPAVAFARLTYVAVPGGAVEVRAAVVERPVVEPVVQQLVTGVLRAAIRGEADVDVNSPLGAGERWSGQWRWESADPRAAFRLDIPARVGRAGIVGIESDWIQYRFAADSAAQERRAASVGFTSWLHRDVETLASVRFERWSGQHDFLTVGVGAAFHVLHDHVALIAQAEQAVALTHAAPYARASTRLAWTSPIGVSPTTVSMRLGADWTSAETPRGLWPIAGGDLTRDIPLRAHSFIVDGALPTARAAHAIVSGGISGDHRVAAIGPIVVAAGLFVDGANVNTATASSWYLDGGAGVRVALAGAEWGALRVDLARGLLTDRRWGLSVGLEQAWPPRLHELR